MKKQESPPTTTETDPRMAEDRCRFCHALIGVGIPELHLGVCDKPECQRAAKNAGKRRTKRYFRRGPR